jgi:hypothetical protein
MNDTSFRNGRQYLSMNPAVPKWAAGPRGIA